MQKAKKRDIIDVYETHHVIPKSLGGNNSSDNIVKLTPREHFISHVLLVKMVSNKLHKRSMCFALITMKRSNNKKGYSRIGNGRLYEKIRVSIVPLISGTNNPFYGDRRFCGVNNPFYGKKHTSETIQKIKDANSNNKGANNSFYGKKHTDETKQRISKKHREPVTILFYSGQEIKVQMKRDIGKILGLSMSMGLALCNSKKHLWKKYNIKEIKNEIIIN